MPSDQNKNVDYGNESSFQQAMMSKKTEEYGPAYSVLALLALKYFERLLRIFETNPEIKKTLRGRAKQILCGAAGTGIGVIFVGPVGAVVGGVVGALIGGKIADDYTPLMKVLRNLSDSEKQRLVKEVQNLVSSALIEAVEDFVTSRTNCELLVNCVRSFLKTIKK
ncbi:uncharacterized protein LOC132756391 [Ruditapes philippinarum]|uniref:uncharacterized protein LOC132756391 n=1 Tax=Ruditapes philippinarum TaxID=129788 RepID=UPI00295C2B38|nr:uncharacterized protein LOC132756391 [Ruditapes philippinarum]